MNRLARKRMSGVVLSVVLMAAACGGNEAAEPVSTTSTSTTTSTTTEAPATTTTTTEAPASTTTTEAPPAITVDRIEIAGEPELVFDWTTDRCNDSQIPDIPSRAIRNAEGTVQLYVGHDTTYRMVGDDLDSVVLDCDAVVLDSNNDPDPARYDEARWLASPYTEDGTTVYGVLHHEYRGFITEPSGVCPLGDYISCLDVSLTMAVSSDGGATFDYIAEPPDHLMASLPYTYIPNGEPSGIWQTSNVVAIDGFYHLLVNINAYDDLDSGENGQWTCLLRSPDLADPSSWRYWDGRGFNGEFVDPYQQDADPSELCAPVARRALGGEINDTVVWDSAAERYVALGMTFDPAVGGRYGVYASFSDDLISWTSRQLVIELPMSPSVANPDTDLRFAYPALLDPDSDSLNFDTTDGQAYLYITRFNAGGDSLDRDLLRYPVSIGAFEAEPVTWSFDTAGDAEGWSASNQLEPFTVADGVMATVTTGDDPYMESPGFRSPAKATLTLFIRMRAEATNLRLSGQVFFLTENDPMWDDAKSAPFQINAEGEWLEYEIDLSRKPAWSGVITAIRIDPGTIPDAIIEFDTVELR